MISQQVLMGGMMVLLCVMVLFQERLVLDKSGYGQRLVRWFGPVNAPWVLRGLVLVGVIVGTLLAMEVIRPIKW